MRLHVRFYLINRELFLPIHDCFDQFHRDASTRDKHPHGIRGHVEEEIAGQNTLDLIAPRLAAAVHVA